MPCGSYAECSILGSAKHVMCCVFIECTGRGLPRFAQALSLLLTSGGDGKGDSSLPSRSGLRLTMVFNPTTLEKEESHTGDVAVGRWEAIGEILPAILEAVGSRSPDKVPMRNETRWSNVHTP